MAHFLKHCLVALGLVAAGVGIAGACASFAPRLPGAGPSVKPRDTPVRLRVQVAGRVTTVALEQYVLGAVLSEVTPTGESERAIATIYEVQAIIARTYAAAHPGRHANQGFDLCDKTHCQLYQPGRIQTSQFAAAAKGAVVATSGRILRHNGRVADTPFHSDCGGSTTTPADAWGGSPLPYLPQQPDGIAGVTHRTWQFAASSGEWGTLLRRDPRTDPGGPLRNLSVTKRDGSGRAAEVEIGGTKIRRVTGSLLRTVVTAVRGDRSLMSTRFAVSQTATGFRLDGTGFGHGVGLCQVGAIARARWGDSVAAILGHYYPGAKSP
ncbi:MAG: SpoIID/LytB domain-containing protein [Vicinamibacterales bacterium]